MDLDSDSCYRALRSRDARFDGRFFTAVRSTGVYCRPICPARTPKRENCLFLPCAAAAREAGFRPCLRCRPEAAPGTPAWRGTSASVTRALRLIEQGALDDGSTEALAFRVGLGERQLRRLFLQHLGAPPVAVAQTRRLLFAKKLIDETRLPMAEIAFAAGFASVRHFNHAVRSTWDRSPRELRRIRPGRSPARVGDVAGASPELVLRLPYRPPFDWPALAGFLSARAIPGVEAVSAAGYRRSLRLGGVLGVVEVRPAKAADALVMRLRLSGPAPLIGVAERLSQLFDLRADPGPIAEVLGGDPLLRRCLRAHPGLRVPGAWDGFELAVRAVLGQQVSVAAATTLAGRLVRAYGEKLPIELSGAADGFDPTGPTWLFPRPEALESVDGKALGLTRARARSLSALASAVRTGQLELDAACGLEASVAALCALPGIGPWTAHYIALRALREPDAFPASDLGLRRALGGPDGPATADAVRQRAEAWRPWRAYAALHLWNAPAPQARAGRPARSDCARRRSR